MSDNAGTAQTAGAVTTKKTKTDTGVAVSNQDEAVAVERDVLARSCQIPDSMFDGL